MGKSNNWKKVEYKVAKILGGNRVPVSGNTRGFKGDVEHPTYFIEVKYGKQIPKKVLKWHERLKFAEKIMGESFLGFIIINRFEIPKVIIDWYEKTVEECPDGKTPILVMKPKNVWHEFVLWKVKGSPLFDYLFTTLKIFAEKARENDEYFKKARQKYYSAIDKIKLRR